MTPERIEYLIKRFFQNKCTQQEKEELAEWVENSADENTLKQLEQQWNEFESKAALPEDKTKLILDNIFSNWIMEEVKSPTLVKPLRWLRIAVAAVFIISVGVAASVLFSKNSKREIAWHQPVIINNESDVYPGKNKAELILDNGSLISLDTAFNGVLVLQGNTKVVSANGSLIYNSGRSINNETLHNTVITHRGQQYSLTLSDGTKVWLNAASSIKFPVIFSNKERRVEVTGEAYFEVAKNAKVPFKVMANGTQIDVLGTSFDINTYTDEKLEKTTLLEGSIKISKGDKAMVLTPGEQASINKNGDINKTSNINVEEIVAWKKGYFHFDNASLETVLQQISRWYDVEIVYNNKVPNEYFEGDIDKNLKLSQVLNILEKSQVHFRLDGKKLIVLNEK